MKQFVSYEKLSKKKKRAIDRSRRITWGDVSPVPRRIESAKAYDRKKHRCLKMDSGAGAFFAGAMKWPSQMVKMDEIAGFEEFTKMFR